MFGAFAARCSGGVVAWFAHLPGSLSSLPCLLLLPLRFGPEDGDCPPRCAAPKCGGRRAVLDRPDRHAARCHIGLILTGAEMLVARYRTRQRGPRSHCHATLQIPDPCSLHHPPATNHPISRSLHPQPATLNLHCVAAPIRAYSLHSRALC